MKINKKLWFKSDSGGAIALLFFILLVALFVFFNAFYGYKKVINRTEFHKKATQAIFDNLLKTEQFNRLKRDNQKEYGLFCSNKSLDNINKDSVKKALTKLQKKNKIKILSSNIVDRLTNNSKRLIVNLDIKSNSDIGFFMFLKDAIIFFSRCVTLKEFVLQKIAMPNKEKQIKDKKKSKNKVELKASVVLEIEP